ncbi:hypothetical protein MAMC_00431 [Methylacidimicrobium cyclopophantes]|uniref:Uncharacterized protein n=1 Tax=Methylacidimicrobium cyclopophantes TaxID=1041766 RepID=A0A5E6M714_9BACT|nr:tetratricopeptide repeat protein [Methylacidimicrobium cyclopophantes]VVM05157.1 hypothetical protein MAMC_00431 [Methylacidimicrobium cyclopophantes]
MNRFFVLFLVLSFSHALLYAQGAHWLPPETRATLDSAYQVKLVVEGAIPQSDPELPAIPYVETGFPKKELLANSGSGGNSSIVYSYILQPLRTGPHTLPGFLLPTDRGLVSVPPFSFWVGEPPSSPSFVSSADASLLLFRKEVWQGEPFPVEYRLLAHAGTFLEITGQPEWTPADVLVDRWSRPERVSGDWRGSFFSGLRYSALAIALNPGKVSLCPVSQHVNMETGKFGQGLFSQAIIRPLVLRTSALTLQVKPLPTPPKEGFTQAVGTFRLISELSAAETQVGEPATWTLRIDGTGNWTTHWNLVPPPIPSGLRVIEPAPRRQSDPDSLFSGSLVLERIVVADHPGRYTIPPYRFTYFDPLAGCYRTAQAAPAVLTVTSASSAAASPPERPSSSGPTAYSNGSPAPKRLPEAPLVGSSAALAPLENRWLFLEAGGAGATLLALWFLLAWRHARRADPMERRRAGLRRLRRIHRQIRRATSVGERQEQLFHWQAAIRDAWLVVPAVPGVAELGAALERAQVDSSTRRAWTELWQEAEIHLYAREATLPSDWIGRSEEEARRIRIPRQSWKGTFARRHFFPAVTIWIVLLSSSWGISALELYRSGRFEQSAELWERSLRRNPTDWIARNNYGAALSQEGRWQEALAQWSSAFLLSPRDSAVRANFALALTHCPGVDKRLSALVSGPVWFRWIGGASPAEWQLLLAIGLLVLFASGVLLLLSRYGLARPALPLRNTLLAVGLSLSTIALSAVALYGPMADPRAGLVIEDASLHSIPTDAEQQSGPVIAPILVVVGKPFLHWIQVRLSDSRSGWLRAEAVVRFFRPSIPSRAHRSPRRVGSGESAFPSSSRS